MKALKINDYNNELLQDFEVIRKVIAGEKGLYEILMRRNNQKLFRVLRSYLNDEDVIKDVMQDTYILAYEKLYQFKEKSTFSTWLIRIGINQALKELRSRKQHIVTHSEILSNSLLMIPNSKDSNPEKSVIQEESKRILEKAIDLLPTKYKSVYILKEVEDMTIKDICECLDLSISNTKVRLHRAKFMLKDILYDQSQKTTAFEFGFNQCDILVNAVMKAL